MSQKPKEGGHLSRCGLVFRTKVLFKEHRKNCQECKDLWLKKRSESAIRWHQENPEAALELMKRAQAGRVRWQKEHPQEMVAGIRRWEKEKPEEFSARQSVAAAAMKRWQLEHPKELKEHCQVLVEAASRWREGHPEEFAQNTRKMYETPRKSRKDGSPFSKAEDWFRKSKALVWEEAQIRCGEERKQVDFVSPDHKTWVEVDGFFHFFEFRKGKSLGRIQFRDAMLRDEATKRGDVMLIRLEGSCFHGPTGKMYDEWL